MKTAYKINLDGSWYTIMVDENQYHHLEHLRSKGYNAEFREMALRILNTQKQRKAKAEAEQLRFY